MNKKDLLAFCNYYKGEHLNPNKSSAAWYVWQVEREWVEEMTLDNVVNDCLSEPLNRYIESANLLQTIEYQQNSLQNICSVPKK